MIHRCVLISNMCAVSLARTCGLSSHQVECYTFGAPRVGNHAYCQYAGELVPEMWHITNNNDVVTKALQIGLFYKREGQRVVVSGAGRMIVRPSAFEFMATQVRGPKATAAT